MVHKSDYFYINGLDIFKVVLKEKEGKKLSLVAEELTLKIYQGDRYEVLKRNSA